MESNPIIDRLPSFLSDFVVDQNYGQYTARDHAVWRYVMRKNKAYLKKTAHSAYMEGLKKTGISTEYIPSIEEMNHILSNIGWAAVCVDGFIPPSAFMAFQAYRVLVIAADIRNVNQIGYTPAPDIIHEAAGHAPIIADPDYSRYLIDFGILGYRAFPSRKDNELYEAIRHLSILKAASNIPEEEIAKAEQNIEFINTHMGPPSELALIRNLHWWTVEYGLVGDLEHPKIYGAGLLSSIKEGKDALSKKVKKIPYSLDAMDFSFDITKPQEQLFVTPNFEHLSSVLNEFSSLMAIQTGGIDGVMKAIESGGVSTVVYSSGLQVSGVFTGVRTHAGQTAYIQATGPVTLNYDDKMLVGHSKQMHKEGFGSPVGKLKGSLKPMRLLSNSDLKQLGIVKGNPCRLELESNVLVEGVLQNITRKEGKIILMRFSECTVTLEGEVLFQPSWGVYDMAVGEKIVSAFYGPADPDGYGIRFDPPEEKTHKPSYSDKEKRLFVLYDQVRELENSESLKKISTLWDKIRSEYPDEWLLAYMLLEYTPESQSSNALRNEIIQFLKALKKGRKDLKHMKIPQNTSI
ncbi:MAG: aromatic amino acid hydroxylase [Bacteroidales bacterium]|nr:aromatic amino acid hydroxylase [Bacteroidales bacterium]